MAVLAVAVALAGGCGSQSYADQLHDVCESHVASRDQGDDVDVPESPEEWSKLYDDAATEDRAFARDLDRLSPPTRLRDAHDDYVRAVRRSVAAFEAMPADPSDEQEVTAAGDDLLAAARLMQRSARRLDEPACRPVIETVNVEVTATVTSEPPMGSEGSSGRDTVAPVIPLEDG